MAPTSTPWGTWDPITPTAVAALFACFDVPWWVAGGYAVELAVGHPVRDHTDIDVLLLRRDHPVIQEVLAGWEWWAADPPGELRPWLPGEPLPAHVHDIWCRPTDQPWRLQFMLNDTTGEDWISRRNPDIREPIAALGATTADGIPYLRPEIQLFYKAKGRRPKDDVDFTAALPVLATDQRAWLVDAITRTHGQDHPWLRRLTADLS
ncbi:amino acid transporter [Actinokineospora auranticolor]|uniref:Aminoglycoside-2''-adenylyltransferase n=1 Tax=Actinokineospora auranticolor TaxID=155976 RepID=A0A2S6GYK6_9PSEU|nr:amino acid transporter [Actinokineospora auranticolor]PPK70288.1 hypothetical protein CLV40_102199 [Actinokineospora auranticolor]